VTSISREPFGMLPDGVPVEQFTLERAGGLRVSVLTFGGAVRSLVLPDGTDVVLGFDTLEGYLANGAFISPVIGRYANRIARGRFVIDGTSYQLPLNDGVHHLHGGPCGFHHCPWNAVVIDGSGGPSLELSLRSGDDDEGYPGALDVRATYSVTDRDELVIAYRAECDAPTHVNLTWHGYFNLAGHDAGDARDHELTLAASRFTPVDGTLIPTGELRDVARSPFDFRKGRRMNAARPADDAQLAVGGGYDHNFVIDADASTPAARLVDPRSGRWMTIQTTEPGIQLYAGQGLNERGKGGARYGAHAGLALETQHFPDSPNQPAFPTTLLRPGELFTSRSVYRFGKGEAF
jgi:aldose 1-epimerase